MSIIRTKRNRASWLWSLLILVLAVPAAAQDARPAAPAAGAPTDLASRFPADSYADRDRLAGDVLALGAAGIADVAGRLVPAGTGNDTAARYALNAVAVYASASKAEPKRALAESALIKALGATTDVEVRTFLLGQLRIVGRDAAVKAATPLMSDAAMVEPATQLMLSVRTPAARAALVGALGKSSGPAQITIVKALGDLKAVEAHDKIVVFTRDANPALRRTALAALARIASPKSFATLTQAAKDADFKYEPSNAVGELLGYAKQLGKTGALATSEKVCRLILANTDSADRLATKAAALAILADIRGAAVLPELLKTADHADRTYRNAALLLAERVKTPNAIQQWITKGQKADPEHKADILAMLGRQGSPLALPLLRSSMSAAEPDVALAAADALAHVERAKAVPDLLALLKSAQPDVAPRVTAILQWTIDEAHLDPLVAMLDTLQPKAKAAAIAVIGAKGSRRFASRVLPLATDTNPDVRTAALGALAGVANPSDLPALFALLDAADTDALVPVQKAVVAAALQIAPESERVAPLVKAIASAAHADRIIDVLPQIGTKQALASAIQQFESSSPDVKAAAFKALTRWPGADAIDRLFAIFQAGNETYRNQAFSGFVRQVSAASITDDQKVLQLKKALAASSTVGDRRILLRAFERVRTFQSFLATVTLLDDADLSSEAAGIAMRIALPTAGKRDGFTGTIVRNALTKALALLKGPQSEGEKESLRAYLASMPADEGFVPMFNGKDLTGWQGLVENPIKRAKMTPEELKTKQIGADEKARSNWSTRDGMIVFNGAGDNLCSIKDYGDFEMLVDWRITKDGDSGIYLRGSPQVQIWDPARTDVGAEVGSGGLYNNQKNPSKPLVFADNPVGEWNTFRITMVGEKVTVYLNGIKVVDDVTMENYWDRKLPIFARGAIELQAHGTNLMFRDIYVREIGGGK
jgi:HEAT repeat protein